MSPKACDSFAIGFLAGAVVATTILLPFVLTARGDGAQVPTADVCPERDATGTHMWRAKDGECYPSWVAPWQVDEEVPSVDLNCEALRILPRREVTHSWYRLECARREQTEDEQP